MVSILVNGAGIAGLALAAALKDDAEVTLVERAPAPRSGGQTVDLRGPGREVARRLGVLEAVRERAVAQRGFALVDDAGRARYRIGVEAFGGHGVVSEVEVLRGDLVDLLLGAAGCAVRWGEEVTSLEPRADAVAAGLGSGRVLDVDLVVGADGTRSAVRALAVDAAGTGRRPIGLATAWFTAPGTFGTDGWLLAHASPGGRMATVRPDRTPATTKAALSFRTDGRDRPDLAAMTGAQVRRAFADRFATTGWCGPRLAAAVLEAEDLAWEDLARVVLPRWSAGRVVLLGDAAWSSTPLTGMGTSFAVVGAWLLAHHLRPLLHSRPTAAQLGEALARWEAELRPWVARRGKLPPGGARGFAPRSATAIAVAALTMRAMTHRPLSALLARGFAADDDLVLPAPRAGAGR